MAAVLAAVGAFVYLRLAAELDGAVDATLRARADDIAALVRQSDSGLSESGGARLTEQAESFAQILEPTGRIVDTTPQLGASPLLTAAEARRASRGTIVLERNGTRLHEGEPVRLLATAVSAQDRTLIVVVGASLEGKTEALADLVVQLAIGGPIALVLACALAYGLAAAALRPVEAMRRQAAAISAADPGRRLTPPPARDEIRRLAETLNDMLERLQAALASERRFIADASHELRTPLALLKTELELALRRKRPKQELEQALESALAETDRLVQLAEDMLVLTQADASTLPVRKERVPAQQLLERVAERFAHRAGERRLVVEADPRLLIDGDPLRVEQALANLVDNAFRHGAGTIALTARQADGAVELHVTDEGPGLPAGFLPHAFERFTRSDRARTEGGAGLGLAIAKTIAEGHGGTAQARNRPGGGADVWLTLPDGAEPREQSSSTGS